MHHVTSPLSLTTKQARAMIKTITYTQLLCLNNGPTLQMTTGNFTPNYKTRVWTFVATTLSWGLLKSNTGNCRWKEHFLIYPIIRGSLFNFTSSKSTATMVLPTPKISTLLILNLMAKLYPTLLLAVDTICVETPLMILFRRLYSMIHNTVIEPSMLKLLEIELSLESATYYYF